MTNSSVISWDAVPGAVDYEVISVASDGNANPPFNSPVLRSALSGGLLSISASSVFSGFAAGPYRVQVKAIAVDPANNSDYSSPINVTYDPKLPAPQNVTVT